MWFNEIKPYHRNVSLETFSFLKTYKLHNLSCSNNNAHARIFPSVPFDTFYCIARNILSSHTPFNFFWRTIRSEYMKIPPNSVP